MLQVKAVEVLERYWLRLTLSNGDIVERNVQDLISGMVPSRTTRLCARSVGSECTA